MQKALQKLTDVLNTVSIVAYWTPLRINLRRNKMDRTIDFTDITDVFTFDEAEAELQAVETELAQKLMAINRYYKLKD